LKPWIIETTTTTAVTPMIIPRSVRNERSLCARMAASASFKVSAKLMALLLR